MSSSQTRALMRRWAVDWLASHDPVACESILAPDYRLTIGAVVLDGRQTYVDATVRELGKFPGLGLTIHDVLVDGDHAAVRFSEHGAASHREGRRAAWSGVALFLVRDGRIQECWAVEDYASRSEQLASGECRSVEPPHVAPWDGPEEPGDPDAEAAVGQWLTGERCGDIAGDTVAGGTLPGPVQPDVLVSSGRTVAFHGRCDVEGFPLAVAGVVRVDAHGTLTGHVVTDLSGLEAHRSRSAEAAR